MFSECGWLSCVRMPMTWLKDILLILAAHHCRPTKNILTSSLSPAALPGRKLQFVDGITLPLQALASRYQPDLSLRMAATRFNNAWNPGCFELPACECEIVDPTCSLEICMKLKTFKMPCLRMSPASQVTPDHQCRGRGAVRRDST